MRSSKTALALALMTAQSSVGLMAALAGNKQAASYDNGPISGGKGDLAGKRRATVARAAARRRRRPMERASRRKNRGR